ncbi:hypothetical protein [Methanothermobacter wolfeii]|uniref:hypothetical protein n=1 Tax=Methanothermobacter wolfeii TaxID=145261 RepID=UPI0024B38AE6|nr:hypothetical protein [Methanothermobacter wolfeii]MDI6703050.1 hypothetical protein [Methanothermobacter wolfeii]
MVTPEALKENNLQLKVILKRFVMFLRYEENNLQLKDEWMVMIVKKTDLTLLERLNQRLNVLSSLAGILAGAVLGILTALLLEGPVRAGAVNPELFIFLVLFVFLFSGSFTAGPRTIRLQS